MSSKTAVALSMLVLSLFISVSAVSAQTACDFQSQTEECFVGRVVKLRITGDSFTYSFLFTITGNDRTFAAYVPATQTDVVWMTRGTKVRFSARQISGLLWEAKDLEVVAGPRSERDSD
jgi:hypothetical protein